MSADDIETTDPVEEDEEQLDEDAEIDDLEPTADDLAESLEPETGLGEVESIQELIEKQEEASEAAEGEDDEDAVIVPSTRAEAVEAAESRVVPIQTTEFTCANCYLVKHRSQLADKRKMLCRDCA
jgi:hypothetical protein